MKNLKYTCSNMCCSFWCESSVLSDFNIYANIYRKFLKKSNANGHKCSNVARSSQLIIMKRHAYLIVRIKQ